MIDRFFSPCCSFRVTRANARVYGFRVQRPYWDAEKPTRGCVSADNCFFGVLCYLALVFVSGFLFLE